MGKMNVADVGHYEKSSASLLSQQLAEPKERVDSVDMAWPELRGHLESRLVSMRMWRTSWWQHWAKLAEYILPRRYHWLVTPNVSNRGLQINQSIIDATGTIAARTLASGMMSGLTSPARPWFKLRFVDASLNEISEVQAYLDEIESRMYRIMAQSNFYDSLSTMYLDLSVFGTAPIVVYEDEDDVIRLYNPCAGEFFVGVSSSLRADTLYRQFTLNTTQIVDMFGVENVSAGVLGLWKDKGAGLETERVIAHAIEPNFPINMKNGDQYEVVPKKFTYREIYWEYSADSRKPLSVRGFNEMPFVVPRWDIVSNDAYGRSPAMDALPDIMQLQVETRRKAEAIEKMVRPPLIADISLKNEPSSILPGHITYVADITNKQGMRPVFEVNPRIQELQQDIAEIQKRIKTVMFNDLFMMISNLDTVRSATEIDQRREEKMTQLGPVVERFENEAMNPLIERIFGIMKRKNLLPPMPPALQGKLLDIQYDSILSRSQKAGATASLERLLGTVGNLVGVKPDVMDNLDIDEIVREYAQYLSVSPNGADAAAEKPAAGTTAAVADRHGLVAGREEPLRRGCWRRRECVAGRIGE